jgi:cephalosporin-C deacetylase-like acetyl esterase
LLVLLGGQLAVQGLVVDVVADRPEALYSCGETAAFAVTVSRDGQPLAEGEVSYSVTVDGGRVLSQGTLTLTGGEAQVAGTLDEPGILRATVSVPDGERPATGLGAAAFEPERIQPGAPEPTDFQAFWDAEKAKLAAVPIDAQLTERPDLSDAEMTVYKISLGNIDGSRVGGWLGVPKNTGPFPAVLTVPWAGVYATPVGLIGWAKRGCLAMAISAHDVDIDLPAADYEALSAGTLKAYQFQGRDSRDTCYFRRVFLSCVRAIDYLTSHPDWNQRAMIVTGSSQGGGLSLVAAGLDPRVTALAANVPALCDHHGKFAGRSSGWPQIIYDDNAEQKAAAQYYDAVDFARRITCPAIVGVGLVDATCPPSSVFAAYNVLQGEKQIVISPRMGHSQSQECADLLYRWIPQQAGLGQ